MLNNRGSTLIAVLALAIILNLALISISFSTKDTLKKTNTKRVKTAALAIAEAGKEHAISLFRSGSITPVAGRTQSILDNISFGGGFYSAWYRANATADTIYVPTSAVYGAVRCSIEVKCAITGCPIPTDSAYNYGLVAGGMITWSGSGNCNTGTARIHCNGQFTAAGSSDFTCQTLSSSTGISMAGAGNIFGNAKTPSFLRSGVGRVTGTTTLGPVATVSIPSIDLTPYYNQALANGQVFGIKSMVGSADVTIPGGVMWVNGPFSYSGSGNITGCIIATQGITISGSGNITAVNGYPAIVSRDGDIGMSTSGDVTGLIYARVGSIVKSGSGDVTGSIICGGSFSKSGTWNTLTYVNSAPKPPNCTASQIIELSWREF
jgi:hypothetical protein